MAGYTTVGVTYVLDELARRQAERQAERLLKYTNQIRIYTIVVMLCTIASAAVAGVTLVAVLATD